MEMETTERKVNTAAQYGRKTAIKHTIVYALVSVFCFVLGYIYEMHGHGVNSNYMIYMFLIPLIGGALPYLILIFIPKTVKKHATSRVMHYCAITTLTVGSFGAGAIEIYGTATRLTKVYLYVGIALTAAAIILFIAEQYVKKGKQ